MNMIWILMPLAVLALLAVGVLVLRTRRTPPATRRAPRQPAVVPGPVRASAETSPRQPLITPAAAEPSAPAPDWQMPTALQAVLAQAPAPLDAQRRQDVLARFREVPRPPRLLTQLVSMDLMQAASSHELVALVSGEPLIAAKVLGAVNSPAYGLSRSISSIGQAVTFLGLNGVRAICMQYALMQTFKADSAERSQRLSALWTASALAGELTQLPAQRVALPDAGGLTSAVVLSFLGRLAVAVAVPAATLKQLPARDAVVRLQAEQARLGLTASQIGQVLMQHWDLPPSIIAEVDGLADALTTPTSHRGDVQGLRWAFGHLCACLGERLAWGELQRLDDFDLAADTSDELACARSFLAEPVFAALVQALRSPAVAQRVGTLLQGLRQTTAAPAGALPAAAAEAAIG